MPPEGGSPLQVGLDRGLTALGHTVEDFRAAGRYDLIVVWNMTAHRTDYVYPDFPTDRVPIVFVDSAEFGYFRRFRNVVAGYANTFAPMAMKHDTKVESEQLRLRHFLEGRSFPYFLREFSKFLQYPAAYHPIDYPLYRYSECHLVPNREEYLRRELDLFVSWGGSHPWRLPITEALRGANTKCEIGIIEQDGHERMEQDLYFERTRAAKCSVSFDGYGSGSFRLTEVLVRCLLLQGPLTIHRYAPLIDGLHCVEYQVWHDGELFVRTNVAEKLREALDDPEGSFYKYQAGYQHCMLYYTEVATAQYVLDVVRTHDWSKPTQLDVIQTDHDEDGEGICLPAGEVGA